MAKSVDDGGRGARMARNLGALWVACLAGYFCALACAVLAVRLYRPPNLSGSAASSVWLERDFLASLASGLLALGAGVAAGRGSERPRAFASLVRRVLVWFALTVLLLGITGHFLNLYAWWIAPTHAFAVLRGFLLWRDYRSDLAWRR